MRDKATGGLIGSVGGEDWELPITARQSFDT